MPGTPWDLQDVPHINDPAWDPLWTVCQDLQVPVCFHSGATPKVRLQAWKGFSPVLTDAMNAITGPVSSAPILANLLFSRILTRFPTLKFVIAETSLAWGAYQLETADHQFERQRLHNEGYEFKPSELFRRQCYMTGWYDRAGLQVRKLSGRGKHPLAVQLPPCHLILAQHPPIHRAQLRRHPPQRAQANPHHQRRHPLPPLTPPW